MESNVKDCLSRMPPYWNRKEQKRKLLKHLHIDSSTNENTLVALLVGILSILFPVLGFFLGIIGVFLALHAKKIIRKTNRSNSSLVTAALICSITGIILQIVIGMLLYLFISFLITEWTAYFFE